MSGKYFDISEIEAAVKYAYALAEDENSPIVEGAYVTCNQSLSALPGEPIRAYAGLKNYTTCNGAIGLGEEDIVLKPESLGVCRVMGEACKPDIEGNKWQECDSDHTVNGKPGVTLNSYMVCLKGGIIAPANDGQRIRERKYQDLLFTDEYMRIKLLAMQWDINEKSAEWTNWDLLQWMMSGDSKNEFIHKEKLAFIAQYKEVICDAAERYDLPEILIAGVVYKEYGGDPMFIDDIAYNGRGVTKKINDLINYDILSSKDRDLTSFGNVSIQVRRAWESLGYEKEEVSDELRSEIIDSLKDPVENIYISSKHISDLRDMQYPDKTGEELTEDEIRVIATRYNRGPDLSLEEIMKNTSYGNQILENKTDIENALKE